MLLAIPVLNGRISPVFDTACRLLLVEVEQGSERARRTQELPDVFPARRVKQLRELGIEVLICGGISQALARMLEAAGIREIAWVAGPVEDVLRAYLEGRLPHPRWMMPGCSCRQHAHLGGSGRRGRRGPRIWPDRGGRMKIAVTVQGAELDDPVDLRFGRAAGFLVVETETNETEYLDNRAGGDAAQGAGLQAAKRIADSGAGVLVTGHCGPNAFRALQAAGIRVHTGLTGGSAREAIARFRAGQLSETIAPDVGGHWQ